MKRTNYYLCFLLLGAMFWSTPLLAQDDLMDLLEEQEEPETEYTYATFKSTRIITSRSVELPAPGELQFVIAHRFGTVNSGWRDFFGLDNANIRFGVEYGATDWLSVGWGRSNVEKFYDAYAKFKFLRQSTGKRKMPISAVLYTSIGITSAEWADPDRDNLFTSRLSYATQLMIARKFNRIFSLQIMPTWVHRNLVTSKDDKNDIFAIGAGARTMITKSVSINVEYFYLIPDQVKSIDAQSTLSIGVDIETGGHVFQIMATNSVGMVEQFYVPKTTDNFFKGDIHIGFNINRMFTLADYDKMKKRKEKKKLQQEKK